MCECEKARTQVHDANANFVKGIQRGYKDREELGCLLMSVKLLLSAVQRDFEMEILVRRSELGAVERCEHETDDTISFGRFPHAYCQASLTQHFPPAAQIPISTHRCKHIYTCRPVPQTHNIPDAWSHK